MGDVLVSINCITYNHENYIGDAIESFLMQKTDFAYEILIGEDCSTDNTREIVEYYAEKYPDLIRVITSNKNVGARQNFQRVRDNSKGKYIAICEGDDYWLDPYKLQKQVDYMEENPTCSVCFHSVEEENTKGKKIGIIRPFKTNKKSGLKEAITKGGRFIPTVSRLYRKTAMQNLPQFYYKAPVGDYPMQIILATKGYAYYMDDAMAAYRSNLEGSWSNKLREDKNYRTKWRREMIHMLTECDKYTGFKYTKEIDEIKIKYEIDQIIENRNIKTLKRKRYQCYIQKLNQLNRYKLYSRAYFPLFYKQLAKIKNILSRIKYNYS